MTVSYINLMRVQQKPMMPMARAGRTFASTAEILEAGKVVRQRLMSGCTAVATPPEPEPAPEPVPAVEPPAPRIPRGAPLDMLAPASWRFLLKLACLRHRVPSKIILGPSRTRGAVAARHDAICLIYQHTQCSLPHVGRLLRRDHTTILHALVKNNANVKLVDSNQYSSAYWRPQQKQPVRRDVLWVDPSPGFGERDTGHAEMIIAETCEKYGVSRQAVCSRSQAKAAILARHEAIYRASRETVLSAEDIGALFGHRDHSTVTYSIRSHEARMAGEPLVWGKQVRAGGDKKRAAV